MFAVENPWMDDSAFFNDNGLRQARIREPRKFYNRNKQRGIDIIWEHAEAWGHLAKHRKGERRIIVYRLPPDNVHYDPDKPQLLQIPYVLMPGEIIPDTDEALLPLIAQIMESAR